MARTSLPRICIAMGFPDVEKLLEHARQQVEAGESFFEFRLDYLPEPEQGVQAKPPGYDTDAWFTAYAPVRRPRIVVCVLIVHGGAGGTTAAPAARGVLQAGLHP